MKGTINIKQESKCNGKPNKNLATITIARMKYLLNSNTNKNSVNKVGGPNLAKKAPKKFEEATKTIIKEERYKVLKRAK